MVVAVTFRLDAVAVFTWVGACLKVTFVVSVETETAVVVTVVVLSDAENKVEEKNEVTVVALTEGEVNVDTETAVSVVVRTNEEVNVREETWVVVIILVDVMTIGVGEFVVIVTVEACGGV